jgi:hypothetical protein
VKKYETKPLPGDEPACDPKDTPGFDRTESKPRLFDTRGRDTPERPSRTRDGDRIVGDGVIISKPSDKPVAFRVPAPHRQDPAAASWAHTVRGNDYPSGPHAVNDALSAMRAETFFDPATAVRTKGVPPCRQLACLFSYWSGQRPYEIAGDLPEAVITEAGRRIGAAKQASVEAWVEFHQPKDMARASVPPPVDLLITRPRIFRCSQGIRMHSERARYEYHGCSWWFVPVQRTLGEYISARNRRIAHTQVTRSLAQLTLSIHTARPGDTDSGRRVTTTESRNDKGEYGREVRLLPNGRIDLRGGGAAPRRATGTLGLKSYTVNRKVKFEDGTTKRVPCQKAASEVRWIKGGPDLQDTVIPLRKTGPKPLFGVAMTPAEKQKRYREKKKAQAA